MICGISLFPLIIVSVVFTINIVAMFYHASRAIPIASMVGVLIDNKYEYLISIYDSLLFWG